MSQLAQDFPQPPGPQQLELMEFGTRNLCFALQVATAATAPATEGRANIAAHSVDVSRHSSRDARHSFKKRMTQQLAGPRATENNICFGNKDRRNLGNKNADEFLLGSVGSTVPAYSLSGEQITMLGSAGSTVPEYSLSGEHIAILRRACSAQAAAGSSGVARALHL